LANNNYNEMLVGLHVLAFQRSFWNRLALAARICSWRLGRRLYAWFAYFYQLIYRKRTWWSFAKTFSFKQSVIHIAYKLMGYSRAVLLTSLRRTQQRTDASSLSLSHEFAKPHHAGDAQIILPMTTNLKTMPSSTSSVIPLQRMGTCSDDTLHTLTDWEVIGKCNAENSNSWLSVTRQISGSCDGWYSLVLRLLVKTILADFAQLCGVSDIEIILLCYTAQGL